MSPFGGFDNFYNLAAPTVVDPFVSVAINEDYKGDPIFKESPQFASRPTPDSQAYWSSTSGIAKTIANTLNTITGGDDVESGFIDLSPDVMEFGLIILLEVLVDLCKEQQKHHLILLTLSTVIFKAQ